MLSGKRLSWITKIEPKPMMEVSLVLSVRQLHDGQNHLFSFYVKLMELFCSYCFKLKTAIIYVVLVNQIIAYTNVLSLFLCPTFDSSRLSDSKFR